MITLEYAGQEKSMGDWGFSLGSLQCSHRNLAASVYSGEIPGASVTDTPLFAFEGKVIIRRKRTGSGTTWSGGYVAFIGYAMPPQSAQDGSGAGVRYTFQNAWYLFDNIPYQQYFASRNTTTHALEYKPMSEVLLFSRLDGSNFYQKITSGGQISDVCTFLIAQSVAAGIATPVIVGTVEPALNLPSFIAREIMCSNVIQKALELSPDVTMIWDYTTSTAGVPTPTISFLSRASRTSKSLAILNGTDHKRLSIVPRYDLQLRGVVLQYRITGSDNGTTWVLCGDAQKDKYGPHGANSALDPDGGLRVLLQTIDLQGSVSTSVSAAIECTAVDANHATTGTRIAWWKNKVQWLKSDKIGSITIPATATIKDDSGSTVSLGTYPNEVTRGQIANWMGFTQKWVTITCKATFVRYHTAAAATGAVAALVTEKPDEKELSVRILVTNATTGTYSALASNVDGEAVPSGIAASIYGALSVLQFEGENIVVQDEASNATNNGPLIHLGHKLNLTGGLAAWTTMNAQIQSITENDGNGTTSISFGPNRFLSAGDLASMAQFNRLRRTWYNPKLRETASLSDNAAELGEDFPKENTSAGSGVSHQIGSTFGFVA